VGVQLEGLLCSLNFFRSKAKFVHGCAAAVATRHRGRVPASLPALTALPGVGPKVGLLVLTVGFAVGDAGVVVDTHVERVARRLGWCDGAGAGAEQARHALEALIPHDVLGWPELTVLLIGFGQQVCRAKPRCDACPVAAAALCPSVTGHVHVNGTWVHI
jgi:endonuclease-3